MTTFAGVSGTQLRQFIEQAEYLEEQKAALASDTREVFAEAKSAGFDVKVIRQILKMRKMDQDELREQEAVLDVYLQALNMSSKVAKDAQGDSSASDTAIAAAAAA
tara:strand:+ start:1274 stop:1591 length:318 start_codon:yes stop_codon:yes gene_type:complete